MTLEAQLALTPLLKGVDLQPYAARLKDWCHVYRDRQVLFKEGQLSDCLVVLLQGSVTIISDDTHVQGRSAPEVIGEIALAGGAYTRTATIVASGLVRTVEIPMSVGSSLLLDPVFTQNLLRILAQKLAQSTSDRSEHYGNENKLIAAFGAHLSPALTAQLLASEHDFGAPRNIAGTILFSDIRGFTARSQLIPPERLAEELGVYFEDMVSVLQRHGAFVDKYVGDAVMAFWGLPQNSIKDPGAAFDCAREMQSRARFHSLAGEPIQIGVGIAMGDIFCGNVGSERKRQFTVLGPAVNFASRCEALCKDLSSGVVLSKEVYAALSQEQQAHCSLRANTVVRGMDPVNVFVVIDDQ